MTLEEARQLTVGHNLYHVSLKNKDGTPYRVKVYGKPQVWKTRPDDIRVPVKFGLKGHLQLGSGSYNYDSHINEWHLTKPTP